MTTYVTYQYGTIVINFVNVLKILLINVAEWIVIGVIEIVDIVNT